MKKIFICLLLTPCVASAQFFTGNLLLQKMNSDTHTDRAVAVGYVMGVSDSNQNSTHCSGQNVTSGQTRDVVKRYLEQNPSTRDLPADILVMLSLGQAFPCPKNKKGGS